MYNILFSLLAGAATFSLLYFTHLLRLGEAIVPSVIVLGVTMFMLGRRIFKQLEPLFEKVGKELQQQRFDAAIAVLKSGYPLGKWQFGVPTQIDSQIGMILYLRKDFTAAIPYLARSQRMGHWLGVAMLAVAYYKKKDTARMYGAFEVLSRRAKKQGLAWNLYAYCLTQLGKNEEAQKILVRGDEATKDDKRVKDNLLALQNGKKMKMRGYAEQWYQFHLDAPPALMMDGRSQFSARRRR